MNLPTDLKNYRSPDDAFQIVPPDLAVLLLIVGTVLGYVLGSLT